MYEDYCVDAISVEGGPGTTIVVINYTMFRDQISTPTTHQGPQLATRLAVMVIRCHSYNKHLHTATSHNPRH